MSWQKGQRADTDPQGRRKVADERGPALKQPAQLEPPQPRTIEQPCSRCGHLEPVLNGLHYGQLRRKAKLTLAEMVRIFDRCGEKVSPGYLSHMERGLRPFREKYAAIYVRLLDRRRRSGQDW